jgi:hypothetical protein
MPYNSAQATKGITILGVTIKDFKVIPGAPWTAGQTVTLQAQSVQDSTPRVGKTIRFLILDMDTGATTHVDATTGSDGYAKTNYTIPFKIDTSVVPCGVLRFRAYDMEANVLTDPIDGKVAYPTRISISAPDSVTGNYAFDITGKLEFQDVDAAWKGLANRTVSLYYNGTKIADVTTGADGSYAKYAVTISTPGTYTLKAVYAGEGFTAAAAAFLGLTVSPQTKSALSFALPLLTGAIVAFASLKAKR